jgi:hypothetical protein
VLDEDRRLLLCIDYEGPWERLEGFFYGVRPHGKGLRWDIPQHPTGWRAVLGWAGDFCNRRDIAWATRHVVHRTKPHPRWKRKTG